MAEFTIRVATIDDAALLLDRDADPATDGIVMCHNDVCMENIVFRDGAAFARMCVPIDDDPGAELLGRHSLPIAPAGWP